MNETEHERLQTRLAFIENHRLTHGEDVVAMARTEKKILTAAQSARLSTPRKRMKMPGIESQPQTGQMATTNLKKRDEYKRQRGGEQYMYTCEQSE